MSADKNTPDSVALKRPSSGDRAQRLGVLLSCHPRSRTVRKKADQPTNPNRPGVRGVRDRPTDSWRRASFLTWVTPRSARGAMPTRISLRRVGSPTRKLMAVPDSLAKLLKPRSGCSNQSFGRGASSYLCAVTPTDRPTSDDPECVQTRPTNRPAGCSGGLWVAT